MNHDYRIQVFNSSSTGIAFTLGSSYLADIPERFGGQRVNLLEGKVESVDWSFDVADIGSYFTQQLADAGGLPHLLVRRVRASRTTSVGASTWEVLATGRISQIDHLGTPGYRVSVTDERFVERNTEIWTSPQSTGIPATPTDVIPGTPYYMVQPSIYYGGAVLNTNYEEGEPNNIKRILIQNPQELDSMRVGALDDDIVPGKAEQLLESDVADDATVPGCYRFMRLVSSTGGQWHIVGWKRQALSGLPVYYETTPPKNNEGQTTPTELFIHDPDSLYSTVKQVVQCYVRAVNAPPTNQLPYHLGHFAPTDHPLTSQGVDPFTVVKHIYNGSYQSTGTWDGTATPVQTVRYSTATLCSINNAARGVIGRYNRMHLRIRKSENMAEWLRKNIYQPLNVLPVVDEYGKVKPLVTALPTTGEIQAGALPVIGSSNAVSVPGWTHPGNDIVTHMRFNYLDIFPHFTQRDTLPDALDGLKENDQSVSFAYPDAVPGLRRERQLDLAGWISTKEVTSIAEAIKEDRFQRYGRGPQAMAVKGQLSLKALQTGDIVKVNTDGLLPNTALGSRGGQIVAQVVTKTHARDGVYLELLHAGISLQPVGVPTISAVASTASPHIVDVTITRDSTQDTYRIQMARSTAPASADYYDVATGRADETAIVGDLRMNARHYVRVRGERQGRLRSAWATTNVQTGTVTPPSALTATSSQITGYSVPLMWTNGNSAYMVDVSLDAAATSAIVKSLLPGYNQTILYELTPGTTYTAYVAHRGPFGGHSAWSTGATFTTLSTGAPGAHYTLAKPQGIKIVLGSTPSPTSSS